MNTSEGSEMCLQQSAKGTMSCKCSIVGSSKENLRLRAHISTNCFLSRQKDTVLSLTGDSEV